MSAITITGFGSFFGIRSARFRPVTIFNAVGFGLRPVTIFAAQNSAFPTHILRLAQI